MHDEDGFLSIEDRNYSRDRRNHATFIAIPAAPYHWEVCDLCDGTGKVVNPSIDAGGLTRDDFDADPDFAEAYHSGAYDMRCPQCRGRSTIPVINGHDDLEEEVKTERDAVSRIVKRALASGYSISLNDGGAWPLVKSTDYAQTMAALFSVGEEHLHFYDREGRRVGWVFLVYGNSPEEVVCDYIDTPEIDALVI